MASDQLEDDGWLSTARRVISPNCNNRPVNSEISLLVIHNISLPPGSFGGPHIEDFFCNKLDLKHHAYFTEIANMEVSAHLLIDRQGKVVQFVPFNQRAWHAGTSSFEGCDDCNDYSIGIELEGIDDLSYTEVQYEALVEVTKIIMATYPGLTRARIVGHCDVSPGRKTDPGAAFDWLRYRASL